MMHKPNLPTPIDTSSMRLALVAGAAALTLAAGMPGMFFRTQIEIPCSDAERAVISAVLRGAEASITCNLEGRATRILADARGIRELGPGLSQLSALVELDLSYNELTSFPFASLPASVRRLDLSQNRLVGTVPPLGLDALRLAGNCLTHPKDASQEASARCAAPRDARSAEGPPAPTQRPPSEIAPPAPVLRFDPAPGTYAWPIGVTVNGSDGAHIAVSTGGSPSCSGATTSSVTVVVDRTTTVTARTCDGPQNTSASGRYVIDARAVSVVVPDPEPSSIPSSAPSSVPSEPSSIPSSTPSSLPSEPPPPPAQLPVPNVSPRGGTYSAPIVVTVETDTPDAWIALSLDGSEPDCGVPQGKVASLSVTESATLRARACANDGAPSAELRERYAIVLPPPLQVAAPVFSPAPGKFSEPVSVSITSTTPGATVYYSFTGKPSCDGSDPAFVIPLPLASTITIRAIACMEGMDPSPVVNGNYQISKKKP